MFPQTTHMTCVHVVHARACACRPIYMSLREIELLHHHGVVLLASPPELRPHPRGLLVTLARRTHVVLS